MFNASNCIISGFTDGYPKIIFDVPNNKIKLTAAILYTVNGWFNVGGTYEVDYSSFLELASATYILYFDSVEKALKITWMNYTNKNVFNYPAHSSVILGYIYFWKTSNDTIGRLYRIAFPEVLQLYLFDENELPFYNSYPEIAAPLTYHKALRGYINPNKFDLREDIRRLMNNCKKAHDIYHPDKLHINFTNEKKMIVTVDSGTNYIWSDKGIFYPFNTELAIEKDTTNFCNQSSLLYVNMDTKEWGLISAGMVSNEGLIRFAANNNALLLAEVWLKIDGSINRCVPFSSQFDACFQSNGIQYQVPRINSSSGDVVINNTTPQLYDISDIGHLDKQDIGSTDYSHIILYGQSLSMGWEAPEVITTEPVDNCYMVGSSPMINHGNDQNLTLNPLVAVKWSSGGEQPIVSLVNSFATLYNDKHSIPQKFIGTNCGEGGRSIERLMKQCTNGTNYYTTEFLDSINSAKAAVDAENKTISCPAIFFMQGEYNYVQLTGAGLEPNTDATSDKEQYKAYLLQLKNDMQADIMEKYGQTKKPLFFIYQVAGNYINRRDMSITMAQIEFAQENEDVFLLNSTYGMPDYGGGHLSTNGYRWYGEMMAKSMYQVFENKKQWNGLELANIQIDGQQVLCDFRVPVLPLIFDTWTKESRTNNGFRVFKDNTEVTISDMTIIGNRVTLITNTDLKGVIEVTYAGQGPVGSGNLRDSDAFNSMYTYYDDRETSPDKREAYTPKDRNGNYIYGTRYPMYNWANHFYYKETIS